MVLPRVASAAVMAAVVLTSAVSAQTTVNPPAAELDECGKVIDTIAKAPGDPFFRSVPYDLIKECYSVFPADTEFKAQHVKELKPFVEAYPFADMYVSPPGPPRTFGAPGIDILKELDRLVADTNITTQYDFYSKIYELTASLDDAHFYYFPFCMSGFTLRQPFQLGAVYPTADGLPVIKILDISRASPVWDEALGTSDLTTFLNYTVKSIDGMPAAEAIGAWASRLSGYSRSPDSQFNNALLGKTYFRGRFVNRPGGFSEAAFLPSGTKSRTYVLSPPARPDGAQPADITVTVPWAGFANSLGFMESITNAEYYGFFCLNFLFPSTLTRRDVDSARPAHPLLDENRHKDFIPRTTTPAGALDAAHTIPEISDAVLAAAVHRHSSLKRRQSTIDEPVPLVSNLDTAIFLLDDGITGVWVFPTVSPRSSYAEWLGTITGGLRALEQIGAKRLIIDATANGGGDFCASTAFAEYILQNTPMIEDQLRLTPAVKALLKTDFFGFNSPDTDIAPSSGPGGDIVAEAYLQDRGAGPQLLSGRFKFCQSAGTTPAGFIRTFNLPELERGWAPEDVSVVSDGGCGSACACMIRSMRDAHPGFKAYTYGGRSGKPYTPTSFEGGIVVGLETFGGYNPALDVLTPEELAVIPGNLTNLILGGIPITQGYSPLGKEGLTFPAEWVPQPSDDHLVVANPTDKKSLWEAVAKKMRVPGPPLPRTRLVSTTTTATTTTTTTTTIISLPTTSQSVATTTAATSSSSTSTALAPESSSTATTTATSKPHPKPYGINAGNHAGWKPDASNNAYAGGAYNPVNNPVYPKPAPVVYGSDGTAVTSIARPPAATAAYAALTSRVAAAASTAKSAGNVYVNAAVGANGLWAAVAGAVALAVAVLAA
ncbi:hypothetical protein HDU96_009135 [Phlyctochytrium bullatum]|nr:hypothetical protein HDU96_009135 [Phlyctochytrium bullatum]